MPQSKKSILKDLHEIERLHLDKDQIELVKKYQEYKASTLPFYRTPGFITTILTAVSIVITATIGYSNFLKATNKTLTDQLKTWNDKHKTDSLSLVNQQNQIAIETQQQKDEITKANYDGLMAASMKHLHDLTTAYQEMNDARQQASEAKQRQNDLNQTNSQLANDTLSLSLKIKSQKKESESYKQDMAALEKVKDETDFDKKKVQALKLFYVLKSNIITLIAPAKGTFSAFAIYSPIPLEERRTRVNVSVDSIRNDPFYKKLSIKQPAIKSQYDNICTEIGKLEQVSSNRFIFNGRTYYWKLNPEIDTLIANVNRVSYTSFNNLE
jgi:hypothetical protein